MTADIYNQITLPPFSIWYLRKRILNGCGQSHFSLCLERVLLSRSEEVWKYSGLAPQAANGRSSILLYLFLCDHSLLPGAFSSAHSALLMDCQAKSPETSEKTWQVQFQISINATFPSKPELAPGNWGEVVCAFCLALWEAVPLLQQIKTRELTRSFAEMAHLPPEICG